MLRAALLAFAALLAVPAAARAPTPTTLYDKGMVSAADPRAAAAGVEILRAGGSATDAAIATMLALTVVEPQSSGIGGGGFYVESDAAGHVETIDGRETAPRAAHPHWFWRDGKAMRFADAVPGGTSVGVPGNIALAARAHRAHGRLPWARLFAPAIQLASEGFDISARLRTMLDYGRGTAAFSAEGRALFFGADGEPLPVGTHVRNPALAAMLNATARGGPKLFYRGGNAREIVSRVTTAPRNPAPMTVADIAGYAAKPRPPVCGSYRTYRICGMGPPSSGATTLIAMLSQLERFDLAAMGKASPQAWHLIAESMRLAYADRARYLGDSDFVAVPVAGLVNTGYLASRSAQIDPARTMPDVAAGTPPGAEKLSRGHVLPAEEHGTSHFSVVDRRGHAVSYTSTIESAFGSGIMVNGYYLNNELTDFDFEPEVDGRQVANRVQGGKRPRSSMSPTLVFAPGGKLRMTIGAAGGATIPAQVLRVIIGVIDWKLSAQDAIALPVLFAPGGNTLMVEKGSALEAMIPQLQALGHGDVRAAQMPLKANAIEVVGSALQGAADPRSEGRALSE